MNAEGADAVADEESDPTPTSQALRYRAGESGGGRKAGGSREDTLQRRPRGAGRTRIYTLSPHQASRSKAQARTGEQDQKRDGVSGGIRDGSALGARSRGLHATRQIHAWTRKRGSSGTRHRRATSPHRDARSLRLDHAQSNLHARSGTRWGHWNILGTPPEQGPLDQATTNATPLPSLVRRGASRTAAQRSVLGLRGLPTTGTSETVTPHRCLLKRGTFVQRPQHKDLQRGSWNFRFTLDPINYDACPS